MTHLLVLGDLNADVLLSIPYYPSPGGDIVTDSYAVQAGGSAANTACALARLGLDVSLIARVGKDSWGEQVRAAVEQAGVRADLIQQDPAAPTGLAFVPVLPGGERTLFCARGANEATDPSAILPECFAGIDWLHLSGYALLHAPQQQAAARALELAR